LAQTSSCTENIGESTILTCIFSMMNRLQVYWIIKIYGTFALRCLGCKFMARLIEGTTALTSVF
jgi:hypothetical protein